MAAGSARTIVVLGDIPATGHFAGAEALRGPALASAEDAAPVFLDLVARNLPDTSEGLLVVYPGWQAETAKRLVTLVRGMLETDQVASIGLDLPPRACAVVADLLCLAAPHLELGHLAGLAGCLSEEIVSGARLATVAKLEHVDTKLTQHMASYSPGSGFVAWAAPQARIDRISRRRPLDPVEFHLADPVHLLVAPQGAEYPELEKELSAALRPQVVENVAAQPLGTTFWGTRKHVEFVAFSGDPQALSTIVRSPRYWLCRWCGRPTSLEICAGCGMFQQEAQADSGSSGAGGGSVPGGQGPAAAIPPIFLTEPKETVPHEAGHTAVTGRSAASAASAPGQSAARSAVRPGPVVTADDDRAVPFGKGARGEGTTAAGGRPSRRPSTPQDHPPEEPSPEAAARLGGPARTAQQSQQNQ